MTRPLETPAAPSPPLKWAGGKRWQVPHLRPLWEAQAGRRLVEPFCGGLGVALALRPERALLNDANPHLIAFYRWLTEGPRASIAMANDEELYYAHRSRFNELLEDGAGESAEAAELFYYLNRTGFNGLCRFNKQGFFNVPFGRYASINYRRDFAPYAEVFAGWELRSGDFESLPLEDSDFIYADPPYDVDFTQYAKDGFSWEDQERAAAWLARHAGPVVLANQATERVVALYEALGFRLRFLNAPRRISCNGDRRPAREVLAVRNVE